MAEPFLEPAEAVARDPAACRLWPEGPARDALVRALEGAADPERARAAAVQVAEARALRRPLRPLWQDPAWLEVVCRLAGASRAFAGHLRRHPRLPERLAASPFLDRPRPRHHLQAALVRRLRGLDPTAPDAPARLARVLRRVRRLEMMRIALRDLTGRGRPEEILGELSDLAGAAFDAALGVLYPRVVDELGAPPAGPATDPGATAPGFCVLAMGKLGGGELNFSSDVDVLYVYDVDGETERGRAAFELYARLAESVTRALAEITEDGFVFRVDLNLRPEGQSGPLVNSLYALESYYETFGRTWERQALIKAAPVAGDLAVGRAALETVRPFVWRRSLDLGAVQKVVALKDELDRRIRARGDTDRDLKLGRGGIRAVELVVQSLQLLHGGKNPRLRDRTTLGALERLLFAGLLDEEEARVLSDAYVFLRRTENRIQMVDDRQTHHLPPEGAGRAALARAMGFAEATAEADFSAVLEGHRRRVEAVLERRFGAAEPEPDIPAAVPAALDAEDGDEARMGRLAELGFADPQAALAQLRRLGRRPWSPFGRSAPALARRLAPVLLAEVARSPDPDQALAHLASFLEAVPYASAPGYHALLLERPQARRLLSSLFSTSDVLSRYLVRHPELLDPLLMRAHAVAAKSRAAFFAEVQERLARHPEDDVEVRLAELRRYRQEEFLRIGLADVSGELAVLAVCDQLSDLAEALLDACVVLASRWAFGRWGWPRDAAGGEIPFAVLGLGKLGGHEMGYGSDLDLLFVYGGPGPSTGGRSGSLGAQEFFSRLAQRLISYLSLPLAEGVLYEIDTRLRPSGRQGMLVTGAAAFRDYHAVRASPWERQALTRARTVAGPAAFRAEVDRLAQEAAYAPMSGVDLRAEIRAMRERQLAEIAQEGPGRFHPKAGRGGLVDIEFLVQYLQLRHGPGDPALRVTGTARALEALAEAGRLAAEDAASLLEAYRFLRRLENRLRIVLGRPIEHLGGPGRDLDVLGRRMGYHRMITDQAGPGAALLEDYRRITEHVRGIYAAVLEDTA